MTIRSLLISGRKKGNISALDEERLLAHVLKKPREYLWSHPEKQVTPGQTHAFRRLCGQATRGTPLPYLTRSMPFAALEFTVTPDVLIPRPETELLVDAGLSLLNKTCVRYSVIDVGTGSGCIVISLAHALLHARDRRHMYHGIDISQAALAVAKKNALRHGVAPLITFSEGNLLEPIFDDRYTLERPLLILANLPYLPNADLQPHHSKTSPNPSPTRRGRIGKQEAHQEPHIALDGGNDGLDLLVTLLTQCATLTAPWSLIAEIDPRQEHVLANDLLPYAVPDRRTQLKKDYHGRPRLLVID